MIPTPPGNGSGGASPTTAARSSRSRQAFPSWITVSRTRAATASTKTPAAPFPERAALPPEDVLGDAFEAAFLAFGARDLRRVVEEAHRVQLAHHRAMIVEVLVHLDQQRFDVGLRERLERACEHLGLEAVDVDLDVIGNRNLAAPDELVERGGDAALPEHRRQRFVLEVERFAERMAGA